MTQPVIQVRNLSKCYQINTAVKKPYQSLREDLVDGFRGLIKGERAQPNSEDFWALKDVSFDVNQGEVVGIIGRNGAGKSTLLKVLSRIVRPTSGDVTIHGRVGSLLEVGTGFHPELTGRENIFMNGAVLGMKRNEIVNKFDEIVAFAEVEKFLDTPVKFYSSGMYVRLAFAVAAHLEPEILIVDEVLAVGDAAFQKKCLGKMGDIAEKDGRTVIFVSHNMTAVKKLCPRALLLQNGNLKADGLCQVITSKYLKTSDLNSFVKQWDIDAEAPQNSSIVIKKIYIGDIHNNHILDFVDTDTDFCFVIQFKVKKEKSSVGLTVIVHDNEEKCIFSSINNTDTKVYNNPIDLGIYESKCVIPKHFFNNGVFLLSLNIFGANFSDTLMIQDTLRFEIQDGSSLRADYYGNYDGVIRPKLQWSTTINHQSFVLVD
jgi:lipopolysaccharide transport system ATP-binding protein